ncbi:MAG: hypothetical protein DMG64_08005 [Acidobacteria bacterium]|nr:MAG: hypothetical protein DMG64_08005 [Acidobacteriota bacterium]PYY21380.1 MAG: hypothetical protein DMG62_18760 [Acidobacteriota bacterium]
MLSIREDRDDDPIKDWSFMKPTLFLRIASLLTLIHCILHTIGGVLAGPKHGAEEASVIETMKPRRFDVMGSMRSYWDFFFGYGLFITLALLVQAVLFWQLARVMKTNSALAKPGCGSVSV